MMKSYNEWLLETIKVHIDRVNTGTEYYSESCVRLLNTHLMAKYGTGNL